MTNRRLEPILELLQQEQYGVLSTISHQYPGFPFGSLCPFAVEPTGEILILVSRLAEHAKNLLADPKASLYIQQTSDGQQHGKNEDRQNAGRVCLLATAVTLPPADLEDATELYLQRFPSATVQLSLGDFYFLRLVPEHIRMINGFGSMFWIHQAEYHSNRVDGTLGPR